MTTRIRLGQFEVDAPAPGMRLVFDGTHVTRGLVACEIPEFAPLRVESQAVNYVSNGRCAGPAVRVQVTGRTIQQKYGYDVVRVRVEWVGDGEPSRDTYCWLAVQNKVWVG